MGSEGHVDTGAGDRLPARQLIRRAGANRLRWLHKARIVRHYGGALSEHVGYVLFDPEVENFTYAIDNRDELRAWLDELCGGGRYVDELDSDDRLRAELRRRLRWRPANKGEPLFGRRAGWYAIVRALKPRHVVETGMHDGLGSTALLAALERNSEGRLVSIDPKPGTGWLVPDRLHHRWSRIRATSYDALPAVGEIDLFIHDSLHIPECERWELETGAEHGARTLLSDNAHAADTCARFAADHDAAFTVWRERPQGHFYPGGGIGVVTLPRAG
jgi:hypothetical protein